MVQLFKRFRNAFQNRGIILMYHRIADAEFDPWNLAVTPENFKQHIKILADDFNVASVDTIAQKLKTRSITPKMVGVTFDDGYRDNYNYALPVLKKNKVPATFYIPSYYIGKNNQFWWDELTEIIISSPRLPQHLNIKSKGIEIYFDLQEEVVLTDQNSNLQKQWKAKDKPVTKRCELYLKIWNILKPLPIQDIGIVMNEIRNWSNYIPQAVNENDLPMTVNHLNGIIEESICKIGLHTSTHIALGCHPQNFQEEEIIGNKNYLENIFKQPVTTLTYPYGSFNEITINIARQLNLSSAFTTKRKAFTDNTNIYQIGRFGVHNWNGEEFRMHLEKWFNKIDS